MYLAKDTICSACCMKQAEICLDSESACFIFIQAGESLLTIKTATIGMDDNEQTAAKASPQSLGGVARKNKLSPERRSEIARTAAAARHGALSAGEMPEANYQGKLSIGDVELDCYVLNDGRRLFHKRGMARALGLKSAGGNAFMKTITRKGLGSTVPLELHEKIENPIVFKPLSGDPAHGYEASALIDICDAIWEANKRGKLTPQQAFLALQAEVILRSAAKVGIVALIDEATGYIRDKRKDEYRELFQEFIRAEFRQWEQEFPNAFFDMIYRLYNLRRSPGNRHPQFFGKFIRKYVYAPLANSNGAILEMLDEKNPVVYSNGGRRYKMFQYLSDVIGLPAFRAHLWQVIGIGNSTRSKEGFDRGFNMAFPQVGAMEQPDLFDEIA